MASAEVLSKPKNKNKDLEAGRRKLEEFRRRKAGTKNLKSKSQPNTDDATPYEKQKSENGQVSTVNSVSAHNDDSYNTVLGSSGLSDHNGKSHVSTHYHESDSVRRAQFDDQSDNLSEPDLLQKLPRQGGNCYEISGLGYQTGSNLTTQADYSAGNGISSTDTGENRYADVISSSRPIYFQDSRSNDSHSTSYKFDKDFSSSLSFPNTNLSFNDVSANSYNEGIVMNVSHLEPDSAHSSMNFPASTSELGNRHLELKHHSTFDQEERNSSNAVGKFVSFESQLASEPYSTGFNSTVGGLFNGPSYSSVNESYIQRSRPSFLDSLNIKDSSVSRQSFVDNDNIRKTKLPSNNIGVSSAIHSPFTGMSPIDPLPIQASSKSSDDFFGNALEGHKSFGQSLESKLEYASQKQNEDFAALEQHIEDLTQQKFSLQRALEASKGLVESLAAENSSLTVSYNQQTSIVNQLKAEMERLQHEIKARMVELEAIKAEYMNAQLECNAADERAKLLAAEVISLEEKALRLRSSELKLERELENSSAEIASYKKKISMFHKECQDLLQTVESLQEEKKLLQSKIRRASSSGISIDLNKGQKKDASSSTSDIGLDGIGYSLEQASSSTQMLDSVDNLLLLQNILAGQEDFALSIPPDQVQMIQNINSLITEIKSEKEQLLQTLITEVSTSTKLKELNKELSQKLEVQTQRLELLTAQSMASEIVTTMHATGSEIVRESVADADEGDEVVERVLGWIMKLFPGGPSKRRTSRL